MREIEVYLLDQKATVPTRHHSGDAGLDLYALEDVFIPIGKTFVVKTGIAARVPEGFVGLLRERSSIGKKGLKVAGGVIDTDYSGDISVLLMNVSNQDVKYYAESGYTVRAGDRIAQLILTPIITPKVKVVNKLWNSERGSKGLGSSGA